MKTPLRYQVTEFDCGTVSLLNAMSYLYKRKDIPAELVRAIHLYTLDCYDDKGHLDEGGTSWKAIEFLSRWITDYSLKNNFDLSCIYLKGEDITYEIMEKCIKRNGVIFIKCWQKCEHYVIITHINELNAYIFDSYFLDYDEYDNDPDIRIIQSKPDEYNRIVKIDRLFSENKKDFSLGCIKDRECVLMTKKSKTIFYAKDIK